MEQKSAIPVKTTMNTEEYHHTISPTNFNNQNSTLNTCIRLLWRLLKNSNNQKAHFTRFRYCRKRTPFQCRPENKQLDSYQNQNG
jgi:hypothetical protein